MGRNVLALAIGSKLFKRLNAGDEIDNGINGTGDDASMRTATIFLITLSILAACGIITNILYDAWRASGEDSSNLTRRRRLAFLRSTHPADGFPLALAMATILQGLIFAGVESTTRHASMVGNCSKTGQIVWPSIWIVPFTALIFSLEAVLRNQSRTYAQRCQKWRVFVCVTLVLTLLLVTWVISRSSPTFDKCFGTLAWWAADYGVLGVMIVSGLLVILPVIAVVLFFQLSHNAKIQSDEHLAGRKMICYLILTTALWSFLLPFFSEMTMRRPAKLTSRLATVVLNLPGIPLLVLYLLFLFGSPAGMGCSKCTSWLRRRREAMRRSKVFSFGAYITSPIGIPPAESKWPTRDDSIAKPHSLKHQQWQERPPMPVSTPEVKVSPLRTYSRYSLFPTEDEDLNQLAVPQPLFVRGHKPSESNVTSATVEIGLRLSHSMNQPDSPQQAQDPSRSQRVRSSTPLSLNPIVLQSPPPPMPTPTRLMAEKNNAGRMKALPPAPRIGLPPSPRSPRLAAPQTGIGAVVFAGSVGGRVGAAWI